MKICIVGNSVGFKMRPPRRGHDELTYSEILERAGHQVHNVSKAGVLLAEQFGLLDDDVLTYFPDAVILHHGIIETYYRRTVRRWNNAAIQNQYRNVIEYSQFQPSTTWPALARFGWRAINWSSRRAAAMLGLRWQWQQPESFLEAVRATCDLVLKETGGAVIVVGISPPSAAAEGEMSGLGAAVSGANAALAAICASREPRVRFVDVEAALRGLSHSVAIPDGIHFSASGHRLLAQALLDCLNRLHV